MMKVYFETDLQVGSEAYYQAALDAGFYGVENKTGRAFKMVGHS